jgi:tetratricopeptide (TPR) repeat protein
MFRNVGPAGRIVVAVLFLVVAVGFALGGYFLFRGYRGTNAFREAEQAYAEGRWDDAKRSYTWYLARQRDDTSVLPKYIDSCLKLLANREVNLRDAGRAYLQLALATDANPDSARDVVDFYSRHSMWRELDYAVDLLLRERPGDPELVFAKALARDRLGRSTEAINAYQELVESENTDPEVYGNLAILLLEQNLREQGWQVLEDALVTRPDDPRVRMERARFLLATNDIAGAAEEMDAALNAGLDTGEASLTAAKVYAAKENWELVRDFAEEAIDRIPDSGEAHYLVFKSYLAERQPEAAITFLSNTEPHVLTDNARLYMMLAEAQIDLGRTEDADRTIDALRNAYPDNQTTLEYLAARRLLEEGFAAEAISKFELVVEQAPEHRVARRFLALAYLENGQREKAKNTFELYLSSNPNDQAAQAIWNATFAERSALEIQNTAIDLLESSRPYLGGLLSTAFSLTRDQSAANGGSDVELAKRLLERAIAQSPSTSDGYRQLAVLYLDQNDPDGAREVLARAETAGIPSAELSLLRAALAVSEGKLDEAKQYFYDELAGNSVTLERARTWAELLAARGHLETGLELLQSFRDSATSDGERLEAYLAEIRLYFLSNDIESARALSEKIVDEFKDAPAMVGRMNDERVAIARALLKVGPHQDLNAAEQLITDIEQSERDRPDVKTLHAHMLLQQSPPDVEGANQLCAAALEAGADDPFDYMIFSEVASRRGDFQKAFEFATKAHGASSQDPNTWVMLARAEMQVGNMANAVTVTEKAFALFPDNENILDLLVRVYASAGRFAEAETSMKQLESMRGGRSDPSLYAWLLVARKDWSNAESVLRKMQEVNPDDTWSIHLLVVALAQQGKWDNVEGFLKDCIARNPDLPDLWVELGNGYLASGDPAKIPEASFAFSQALALHRDYYRALRGLLEVQLLSGNPGGALGLCDRLVTERPNDADMLARKSYIFAQLPGREEEALAAIESAVQISPKPMFLYQRGYLRLERGDFADAIEDFQQFNRSGQVAPSNLDLLMAEAYLGLKNFDLARGYFESAREKAGQGTSRENARLARIAAQLEGLTE